MKNLKSVLAVLAAVCLMLCLAVPVFATGEIKTETETTTEVGTENTPEGDTTGALPGAQPEDGDIKIDPSDPDAVDQLGEPEQAPESDPAGDAATDDHAGHDHSAPAVAPKSPNVLRTIVVVLEVITSVALIVIVLAQSGKESGLSGALSGNSDSYMSKSKRATLDKKLASMTKWVALVWVALTLALGII